MCISVPHWGTQAPYQLAAGHEPAAAEDAGEPLFGEDWWREDQQLFKDRAVTSSGLPADPGPGMRRAALAGR